MAETGDIDRELCSIWNRKLYRWWHHYNDEFLSGRLKLPLIELGDIAPPGTEPVADSGSDSGSIEPFASAKVRAIDAFERRYLTTLMHEAGGNTNGGNYRPL